MTVLPSSAAPASVAAPADIGADLASLLCSRLCHDLLSPVGALSNGVELLGSETDPAMRQQCLDLLGDSARSAALKLRFFRLAFGAAGGYGDAVPTGEAREVLGALVADKGRIVLEWAVAADTLPTLALRTLLNLALLGFEALVRGGTLAVAAEQRGGTIEIVVRAEAMRLAFDPSLASALAGTLPASEIGPRTAPAVLLARLVAQRGGSIRTHRDDTTLVLGAVLPVE